MQIQNIIERVLAGRTISQVTLLTATPKRMHWFVRTDRGELIVRIYRNLNPAVLAFAAEEISLAYYLSEMGFHTPRVLSELIVTGDDAALIIEYIQGKHPDVQYPSIIESIGRVLCRFHKISEQYYKCLSQDSDRCSLLLGNDLHEQFLSNEVATIAGCLEQYFPWMNECISVVTNQVALRPNPIVVVHNDVHLRNLILHDDDIFLLDWGEMTIASPYQDIGRSVALFHKGSANVDWDVMKCIIRGYQKEKPAHDLDEDLLCWFVLRSLLAQAIRYIIRKVNKLHVNTGVLAAVSLVYEFYNSLKAGKRMLS